jgi:hypothetical protein
VPFGPNSFTGQLTSFRLLAGQRKGVAKDIPFRLAVNRPVIAREHLCFDGIDYFARVWLNGTVLGRHEGMFGGPVIETGLLVASSWRSEILVVKELGDLISKLLGVRIVLSWQPWDTSYETLPTL